MSEADTQGEESGCFGSKLWISHEENNVEMTELGGKGEIRDGSKDAAASEERGQSCCKRV